MASDPSLSINGNYAAHAGYGISDQSYNGHSNSNVGPTAASYGDATATATSTNGGAEEKSDIPKEEVGWYFVEQYYTTLSKTPEKLYVSQSLRSK